MTTFLQNKKNVYGKVRELLTVGANVNIVLLPTENICTFFLLKQDRGGKTGTILKHIFTHIPFLSFGAGALVS